MAFQSLDIQGDCMILFLELICTNLLAVDNDCAMVDTLFCNSIKPNFNMKKLSYLVVAMFMVALCSDLAVAQKLPGLDPSPTDIVLLRTDGRKGDLIMKITYGRPQKKGRTMLGGNEPYGKVWRTGANESTEVKLYRAVTFGDKTVQPGTYTLYSIPNKDKWTIIINSKLDTWGAYEYDETKDVARIEVPAGKTDAEVEAFTIAAEGNASSATLALAWENTLVKVALKY